MTTKQLKIILVSKPRRRVVKIAFLWVLTALLKLVKMIAYLPAAPFLRASNALYRAERSIENDVGDIWMEAEAENERQKLKEQEEELWN